MPITENREHLSPDKWARMTSVQKADFTLSFLAANGGRMEPTQSKEFWDITIKESDRLPRFTIVPMKSDTHKIDSMGFTSQVLHAATSGQSLPQSKRSVPELGQEVLVPKLFKGQVNIDEEVLEDNILQERLRELVMTKITAKVRQDMLKILIQSDTASADDDFNQFDGLITKITSNVVDAAGAGLSKALWEDLLQVLPDQFHQLNELTAMTSSKAWIKYMGTLSDRETEFAERVREQGGAQFQPRYMGIPIEAETHFPNDIGTGSVLTAATLFKLKNYHVGIHRDVKLKMDEDITAGVIIIVVSVRFVGNFAHEGSTAIIENVLPA